VVSTGIRVIKLGQFAVLSAYLGEACPGLQMEQVVFCLQMGWDVQLRGSIALFVKKCLARQEQFHE